MHSSIIAWRIPWTEEPGGLQYIGSWRVGCGWSNLVLMHKPGILFSGEGYVDYGWMGNNCIILTRRRSNQSILKEISPGISLEWMMLKLKLQYFGHLMRRVNSLEKTLMLGGIGGRRRRGRQRMKWLDGITDSMDWVSVNSGSWWWTGRPGVLQFMGLQRVEHNWATELNWTELDIPWRGCGNALQYSCLENLMDRGAWWATVPRVMKSWMWLKQLSTHAQTWYTLFRKSLCWLWSNGE